MRFSPSFSSKIQLQQVLAIMPFLEQGTFVGLGRRPRVRAADLPDKQPAGTCSCSGGAQPGALSRSTGTGLTGEPGAGVSVPPYR